MAGSTFAPPPYRFEAGTPPIVQAVGLAAALDYVDGLGMDRIADHETMITGLMLERLQQIEGLRILGPTQNVERGGAVAFTLEGVHPHDIMQMLDARGVAVRGGHHCARPLHDRLGIQSSVRASGYLYTTPAEVDALAEALVHTRDFFAGKFATGGAGRIRRRARKETR